MLQIDADVLRANSARYVRPILLVQVERTGKDQIESGKIHSADVIGYLKSVGLHDDEIAEKTSEKNDLRDPERQDLLSPTNRTRVIVTKQALQEGWDCPFAYVLCSLAAASNMSAMTQLIGRILRQPDTQKTGNPMLDECYVFCHHASTGEVVNSVRTALERDGMGDVTDRIRMESSRPEMQLRSIQAVRRTDLAGTRLFAPRVLWLGSAPARELDWEQDILYRIDWSKIDVHSAADNISADKSQATTYVTRLGLDLVAPLQHPLEVQLVPESIGFDAVYMTRSVLDLVPNAWIAREIVGSFVDRLRFRGWTEVQMGSRCNVLIEELRKFLAAERDKLAEAVYRSELSAGRISFSLLTDAFNWELPGIERIDLPQTPQLFLGLDGRPAQRSLFDPVYRHDYNELEYQVACYLDGEEAISWWYRNVVRPNTYSLLGWRKNRVYPDFLFAFDQSNGSRNLVILETKGDQLAGNLDTEYKSALMELLTSEHAASFKKLGTLELETASHTRVNCDLVYGSDWRNRIAGIVRELHSGGTSADSPPTRA